LREIESIETELNRLMRAIDDFTDVTPEVFDAI
jgi:hypothetical protein